MPSNTQIKIRYGMILQAVLSKALKDAGFSFAETPAYDPDSEVPDFLIPDAVNPRFMVEVHQTEARNHFQMKTLRSVTAVAEAKAFFGAELVSVNVLFGDPDRELPAANLRAMCGIFDVNVILRRDASAAGRSAIAAMETAALKLAGDTALKTAEAANRLVKAHVKAVREFERLLKQALSGAVAKKSLRPMWKAESVRRAALGDPPTPGEPTFYKKNMVRSLFFKDEHFKLMTDSPSPDSWDPAIIKQVVATGIGTVTEEIDGDHVELEPEFLSFLRDPDAPRLRGLCKAVLDSTPSMRWFFEDIRDEERRLLLVRTVQKELNDGDAKQLILKSIATGSTHGISHERCWPADVMASILGVSHNRINRWMCDNGCDPTAMGNPFNQLCYRSARFLARPSDFDVVAEGVLRAFRELSLESLYSEDLEGVSGRLLKLRLVGAMRLRQLDALPLLTGSVAAALGLNMQPYRATTILSDISEESAVAAFEFYSVNGEEEEVLVHTIAAEGNPRDKAKEWGARRLATLYRAPNGIAVTAPSKHAVFVIDGTWNQADVTRLHRCGWTHVIRMGQLEAKLRDVFNLTQKPKTSRVAAFRLDDIEDLPMAAEED